MDKRIERILALASGLTLVWLMVDVILVAKTRLAMLPALLPYLALAAGVCLFVLVRLELARRAEEEQRAQALARQERPESALFGEEEGKYEPFTAGAGREQFERWVVPAFGVLLVVVEGVWAWHLFRRLSAPVGPPVERLLAAAFLAGQTFTLFLLSRYLLGLSRMMVDGVGTTTKPTPAPLPGGEPARVGAGTTTKPTPAPLPGGAAARAGAGTAAEAGRLRHTGGGTGNLAPLLRLARGPGVMLGVGCFTSLLALLAAVGGEAGYARSDRLAAVVLIGFLALLAVENLLNVIGDLYRPRRGKELGRAYESRLGGLLTDPGTWVKNVAGALDYQFGYKVSETWLYRFLERALLPLVLFQLVVLYGLSTLVFLEPEEEAIVERLGRPRSVGWHLASGFHWKWPWPFETVRRYPVKRILRLEIGYQPEPARALASTILWTVPHYTQEDQFLTASRAEAGTPHAAGAGAATNATSLADTTVPVNLMAFNMPVEYRIADVRQYAYGCADPQRALDSIAYRSLTLEVASRGLFDVMTVERLQTAEAVRARIQREADQLGLGIEVLFVGLSGAHPPVSVAGDFEAVIGATEEREAAVLRAQTDANRILPIATAEAAKLGYEAGAYAVRRTAIASAEADQFLKRLDSFERAPAVFRTRLYLNALRGGLVDCRKYIVAAAPSNEVVQFDFTEKLRPELFDFGSAAKAAPEPKK